MPSANPVQRFNYYGSRKDLRVSESNPNRERVARQKVRPPALRSGDTIAVIAPASAVCRADVEAGAARLRDLGYNPVYSESIFDSDLYFAGTLERRARELQETFQRDDVKAVLCARGGYGANYLLPRLDVSKLLASPKIFIGYSDITTLLTRFADSGLVVFHGPMAAKDFAHRGGVHLDSWRAVLGGEPCRLEFDAASRVRTLRAGQATGELYGGCLSMLVASLGTPYEVQTSGKILLMEDIGAKPYQVDRMLMQLRLAGKLDGVRAIVFGEMVECVQPVEQPYTLQQVVERVVGDLGIPVVYGLPSGHVTGENITLPLGVEVSVTASVERVAFEIGAATIRDAQGTTRH